MSCTDVALLYQCQNTLQFYSRLANVNNAREHNKFTWVNEENVISADILHRTLLITYILYVHHNNYINVI